MWCSMTATACSQIWPVRRHWRRGHTVSISISEWILMVTLVGLAPDWIDPVMMWLFLVEPSTAPRAKMSLPALFAFHPATFAIHCVVTSIVRFIVRLVHE